MKVSQTTYIHEYLPGSSETPWNSDATSFQHPDNYFIISQSPDGVARSYFGDNEWRLYSTSETIKRNDRVIFEVRPTKEQNINTTQIKSITLALMRHAYRKANVPLAPSGLNPYVYILKIAREYAENINITIWQLLSNPKHVKYLYDKKLSSARKDLLPLLLFKLSALPFRYVGFKPALMPLEASNPKPARTNQTTVIPAGIYLELINSFTSTLSEFNTILPTMIEYIKYVSQRSKRGSSPKNRIDFVKSAQKFGLGEYFIKWAINDHRNFSHHLGTIQYCCIMLIYVFTGMRRSEAYSIKCNSLERIYDETGKVVKRRFIHGVTSKLKNHPTPTKWVTSIDIELPFTIASTVASVIYAIHGLDCKDQPIFISIAYLPFCPLNIPLKKLCTSEPAWGNFFPVYYHHKLGMPLISESHIGELETIAPARSWRAIAEFSVGRPWPLAIHQIRRSTAIYAIRSGLVSLPALKYILHHITVEMSMYYARGSSFAHDLLKDSKENKPTFVNTYQDAELQVRAWQYANEFVLTDEVLHGPHGLWLRGKAKDASKSIAYAELIDDTLKRMKRGELHYQPTPVGGCTSGEVCHKRISVNFLGCDGCKSAAIKPSKVLKLIEVQEALVSLCEVDSPELNAENQTLFELKEFAQTMGICA